MDVMRKAIYMLSVLCLAALWGGCQRGGGEETAQVTLRFNTRAGSALADEYAKKGEGMKDLQIVLYRRVNGVYTYYKKYDHEVPEGETGSTTVDLGDVQLGDYLFYVVANGASAGLTVSEEGMTEEAALRGHIMRNGAFPAAAVPAAGLPMAGSKQVIVNQERVTEKIEVVRAVARLDIELENVTGDEIRVERIPFGAFGADRAYLFGQGGENEVMPDEVTCKEFEIPGRNEVIATGGKANYVYYIYPSAAGAGKYTMGLKIEGRDEYKAQDLLNDRGLPLTEMPRNTVYKIRAVVDVDAITFRGITVDGWETSYSGGDINIGNND